MIAHRYRSLLPALVAGAALLNGLALSRLEARVAKVDPPRAPAPEATLRYEVRDPSGAPIAAKLSFVGVGGTGAPAFTVDDIGRQEGDAIAAHDRIMSASGLGVARVPLGTYDIWVSRGPEWEVAVERGLVVAAGGASLSARIAHVVDTRGWVSGDFHVHAAMSSDSNVPMRDRIYEFLADGVEVIASTDHNTIADYAPIIGELGVGDEIASIPGDELTTDGWGHFGAFPLPPRLGAAGQGSVPVASRSPGAIFAEVRRRAPGALIDVHHPREHDIGYFDRGAFDPGTGRATGDFSFDFDAVEVLNGYQDADRAQLDRVLRDWFALLAHGHVVTATGNSDTHHLDGNVGGYPRNYVRVGDDRPASVTPEAIAAALRAHRALFTTGPFITLRAAGADIGDVADARRGRVDVTIEVQAAPWVSVSRVILYQCGREVRRWSVPASKEVRRFRAELRLSVATDGFLVARAEGDEPLAPVVGDAQGFRVCPVAVTNPIFLDRDGNGVYDAPLAAQGGR